MLGTPPQSSSGGPSSNCRSCTAPDDNGMMQCSKCRSWWHITCLPTDTDSSDPDWMCTQCHKIDDPDRTALSSRSARARRRAELRRLDEERKLRQDRLREAAIAQQKLDDEYLRKKYAVLEEISSEGDFTEDEEDECINGDEVDQQPDDTSAKPPAHSEPNVNAFTSGPNGHNSGQTHGEEQQTTSSPVPKVPIAPPSSSLQPPASFLQPPASFLHPPAQHRSSSSNVNNNVAAQSSFYLPPPIVPPANRSYPSVNAPGFLPGHALPSVMQNLSISSAVAEQALTRNQCAARQALSKELPTFSGRPEEWPIFLSNFERSTRTCGFTNDENLIRLQKCLTGAARNAVSSRLLLPAAVPGIIQTLQMLFGRPELILHTMLSKLRSEPAPKADRLETLITFALSVQNLCATMEACHLDAHLRNPMLLQEIVDKLPTTVKLNWAMYQQCMQDVTLTIFSDWLFNMAQAASAVSFPTLSTPTVSRTEKHTSKEKGYVHAHAESSRPPSKKKISSDQVVRDLEQMPYSERWTYIKQHKLCKNCLETHHFLSCKAKTQCGTDGCTLRHNKLLHNNTNTTPTVPCNTHEQKTNSVLFRVVPVTLYGKRRTVNTYAFLDEGSSLTLMDEEVAEELELPGTPEDLCLKWTADTVRVEPNSRRVVLQISGQGNNTQKYRISDVRTVKKLSLPIQSIDTRQMEGYEHLRGVPFQSYANALPRILIGIDNWRLGLPTEVKEGEWSDPVATKTRLGWTIHGRCQRQADQKPGNSFEGHHFHICDCSSDDKLKKLVKNFFSIENLGVKVPEAILESQDDKRAKDILLTTTKQVLGRYETGLLWRYDEVSFPDSYLMAKRRMICLERKMAANPILSENLKIQMKDYVAKSYARKLSKEELSIKTDRVWYLPVFTVTNVNKPDKIRMVWDAAAKVDGISLNSMLLKGPDQLTSLPAVLYGFRQRPIAICGDIKEMFHQVRVRADDQQAQRFLWRDGDSSRDPDVYVMQVMTFGASCSPSSAQYVKNTHALKFADKFPRAVSAIIDQHYVDDYLDSADTVAAAIELANAVKSIHMEAGFEMRHWLSNSLNVLKNLQAAESTEKDMNMNTELTTEKVLGMWWSTSSDMFKYSVAYKKIDGEILTGSRRPTKREVLRTIMSIFDPLGFLSSFIVYVKILLRDIWRDSIGWDDEIGDHHMKCWLTWIRLLPQVEDIRIPRCYTSIIPSETPRTIQLHVFVDASENAYGAVAYFRIQCVDTIECSIVMAKTKVAPQQPMSIPRLELQAAVLGARLANSIIKNHKVTINKTFLWSDSRTVLCWLRSNPRNFKQFVSFRIGEILETTDVNDWRWISTKENVADEATKWHTAPDIRPDSRWFTAPQFLYTNDDTWPQALHEPVVIHEEMKVQLAHTNYDIPSAVNFLHFSNWFRLLRAQALVFRAVQIFNAIGRRQNNNITKLQGPLTSDELERAELQLFKRAQCDEYPSEVIELSKISPTSQVENTVTKSSSIAAYSPYMNECGILCVKGRIDAAKNVEAKTKRPIIMPRNHHITRLLIQMYHRRFHHHNGETVINELKQKFSIPRLRQTVRTVVSQCQRCKNFRARPAPPEMAQLPYSRLASYTRPFTYIGLDYFGPITVSVGRRVEKRWGVLITCLTVRAIHLEIAHSLTSDSCIMCLRNFMARRGTPAIIHCDNGTNFRGAERELRESLMAIDFDAVREKTETAVTRWHFNPPAAPHMGGSWERLVGSVKRVLRQTMPDRNPNDEVLRTMLMEAENVVNSRPLTHVSIAADDEEALTPNHFLVGSSNGQPVPGEFSDRDLVMRKNWRISQQLANRFWKRWIHEYLPTLTRRTKWFANVKNVEKGDIVIIVDDTQTRNCWPKGVVMSTIAGRDGIVRRATVRTSTGLLERPVTKLAVLDVKKVDCPK